FANGVHNSNISIVALLPRHPLIAPASLDLDALVAGPHRLLAFLDDGPDAAVAEPDVAEIERSIVHRNMRAPGIADQLPGRLAVEFADDVEQSGVQVPVPGEQIGKRGIAAGDAAGVHRIQLEWIRSDQRLE